MRSRNNRWHSREPNLRDVRLCAGTSLEANGQNECKMLGSEVLDAGALGPQHGLCVAFKIQSQFLDIPIWNVLAMSGQLMLSWPFCSGSLILTRLKERLCTFSEHLICKHKSLTSCNTAFRTLHWVKDMEFTPSSVLENMTAGSLRKQMKHFHEQAF